MKVKTLGLAVILALVGNLFVGCGAFQDSSPPAKAAPYDRFAKNPFPAGYEKPNDAPFSQEMMLVNLGVNVVYKNVRRFRMKAENLSETLNRSCQGSVSASVLNDAQSAWKETMLAYHAVEAAHFGPIAEDKSTLQTRMYAWPFISACGIDQEVEAAAKLGGQRINQVVIPQATASSGVPSTAATPLKPVTELGVNLKGLGAIEYLLFEPTLKTRCNARAFPQMQQWSAKSTEEKLSDRCQMAQRLAKDVEDAAKELEKRWSPDEANYTYALLQTGFKKTMRQPTTELVHGMFAIEKVKDDRLGRPLGLHKSCASDEKKCVEDVEHSLSGLAMAAARVRVEAFRELFFGSSNPDAKAYGIDDFLVQKNSPSTVDELRAAMDQLLTSMMDIENQGALQQQIQQMSADQCQATTRSDRRVPLCAMFQDLREVSTLFKVAILTKLTLDGPPAYQGDND